MRCLYCGRELALLKRLAGNGAFCSEAHREDYRKKFDQIALGRLRPDLPVTAGSNVVVNLDAVSGPGGSPQPWARPLQVPFAAEPPHAAVELAPPTPVQFHFEPVVTSFPAGALAPEQERESHIAVAVEEEPAPISRKPLWESPEGIAVSKLAPITVDLSFLSDSLLREAGPLREAEPQVAVAETPVEAESVETKFVEEVAEVAEVVEPVADAAVAEVVEPSPAPVADYWDSFAFSLYALPSPEEKKADFWDAFDFASVPVARAQEPEVAAPIAAPVEEFSVAEEAPAPVSEPVVETEATVEEPIVEELKVEQPKVDQGKVEEPQEELQAQEEVPVPPMAGFLPLTLHGLAPSEAKPISFNRPVRVEVELRLPKWNARPMGLGGINLKTPAGVPPPPTSVFKEPVLEGLTPKRPPVVVPESQFEPVADSKLPQPVAAPYTDVEIPIPVAPAEAVKAKKAPASNRKVMLIAAVLAIAVLGWALSGRGSKKAAAKTPEAAGFTVEAGSPRWIHDWSPAAANAPVRFVSVVKDAADLKNFRLEFTGKIQNQAMAWVFRAKDPKNYYVEKLEILKGSGQPSASLTYYAVVDGAEQRPAQLALLHDLPEDGVYKIRFEANGNKFSTWINGQEAGDFTDEKFDRGSIGQFSTGDEAAELQDGFHVTLLDAKKGN